MTAYDVIVETVVLDIPGGAEIARQVVAADYGVNGIVPQEVPQMAADYVTENDVAVSPTVGLTVYITEADSADVVASYSIGGHKPDRAASWDVESQTFRPY